MISCVDLPYGPTFIKRELHLRTRVKWYGYQMDNAGPERSEDPDIRAFELLRRSQTPALGSFQTESKRVSYHTTGNKREEDFSSPWAQARAPTRR
jgi:hypothetical protein